MNPNSEKDIEKLQWIHDWQYKEVMYRRDHAFRLLTWSNSVFVAWLAATSTLGTGKIAGDNISSKWLVTATIILLTLFVLIWENYNFRAYLRNLEATTQISDAIRQSISSSRLKKKIQILDGNSYLSEGLLRTKYFGPVGNNLVTLALAILSVVAVWAL